MTVVMLVMGLVALESRMVAGERCTLGQHREMQVAFTRSSIIAWWYCARCVVGKIIQVSHFCVRKFFKCLLNWLLHYTTSDES